MTKSITLVIFIAIVLFIIYINKPSGHNQIEYKYQLKLDSVTKVYEDSLHKRELFYLESFSKAQKSSDRWEGEAKHWKSKYNEEKRNNRHFSDSDTDSLLAIIR